MCTMPEDDIVIMDVIFTAMQIGHSFTNRYIRIPLYLPFCLGCTTPGDEIVVMDVIYAVLFRVLYAGGRHCCNDRYICRSV